MQRLLSPMQKQEATILSAQFSGFLKLIEGLPSEKISDLMNEVHAIIQKPPRLLLKHQKKLPGIILKHYVYGH